MPQRTARKPRNKSCNELARKTANRSSNRPVHKSAHKSLKKPADKSLNRTRKRILEKRGGNRPGGWGSLRIGRVWPRTGVK